MGKLQTVLTMETPKRDIAVCFGEKVRKLRHIKSISQEELAALAGVHRTYIGMVERGEKNVTIVTMFRLAEALGIPPAELIKDLGHGK